MKKKVIVLVVASLIATFTCFAQAQTPPAGNFRFQNIDVPGASATLVGGLNNRGQMVGFYRDAAKVVHGYFQDGTDIQEITFPNAHKTFPAAINNAGEITGSYSDGVRFHGFTLERGVFTTVDFPGAAFTNISDLNDRGDLVGLYLDTSGGFHGFTLDKNGFTSFDDPAATFPSPSTQAFGINNRKVVNGDSVDANGNSNAFVLAHGVFHSVNVPGAVSTALLGLNDSNDQVGNYIDQAGVTHGFLQRGDHFTTFDFPGVSTTLPFQINDPGTIVGLFIDNQGAIHSFLAEQRNSDDPEAEGNASVPFIQQNPGQSCVSTDLAELPLQTRLPKVCTSAN
ncbi:MAG TPA: hypothetical protein VFF39_09710 [Verrucomicrobiae bacterium]|nr:hypothetical protein [Verrucomicrobiae bacterium]